MGKVKQREKQLRKQEIRANPIGIPSLRDVEEAEREGISLEGAGTASNFVQTVLEQLQSPMVEERDSGLNSLSMVLENPKILDELLSHNILQLVAPLLMDPSTIVRHSAAGALRNMSTLGPQVVDLMNTKEVLRPLAILLRSKYGSEWTPQTHKKEAAEKSKDKVDSMTDCLIQAMNIVWNLCETSQESLDFLKKDGVFTVILKCLNSEVFGLKLAVAAAQCLNTVTEGSNDIISDTAEFEIYLLNILSQELIKENLDADWVHFQVLIIGILVNLHEGQISKLQSAIITKIIHKLSAVLELNHIQEIKSFSSSVPIPAPVTAKMETSQNGSRSAHTNGYHKEQEVDPEIQIVLDTNAESIQAVLDAQTMALELLSNILFGDDESNSDSDDENESDTVEDSMMDDDLDNSMEVEMLGDSSPAGFVVEVCEGIKAFGLITKVTSKTSQLPENVLDILRNNHQFGRAILCKLHRLQSTSLLCFQNMIGAFSIEDLGGIQVLRHIWNDIFRYIKEECQPGVPPTDVEFLTSSTSCLRGILQKVLDESCPDFFESLSLEFLQVFLQLYSINIPPLLTNVIRIIGGVGILISREKKPTEDHQRLLILIGEFLLNCVIQTGHHDNLIGIAEALDTIFDVFAEDDYNGILKEIGMIQQLKAFVPQFKKIIRYQRKQLGDNKAIVETSRTNLTRFIDYKIKHGAA